LNLVLAATVAMTQENSPEQDLSTAVARLRTTGFAVSEQDQRRFLVSRDGCAAILEDLGGTPRFSISPGLIQGNAIARLVDAGFQKFWQVDRRRFPARAEELKALHGFEQDLRAALGATTLYNQALGTVSSKYVYDRLEGREPGKRHQSFD
jgi:hypothetical protein